MFTGDLERKTYADLEAFLAEGLPEGTRLDYKREVPARIERTIAAMANSEGGVIVIGVDEEGKTRKPKLPPAGITLAGQAERVQAKAYQAIHEPITALDFGTYPFPDNGEKGVLVVRVHPSERAPHAVDQGRAILRRVGAQAMKEGDDLDDRMDVDRMVWLVERRTRNQQLIDAALARYESLLLREPVPANSYRFDLVAHPAVAHAESLTVKQLRELLSLHSQIRYKEFPVALRAVSGGLVSIHPQDSWSHYFDTTGLTACVATWSNRMRYIAQNPTEKLEVYGSWWLDASLGMLKWVGLASKQSGRGGTLRIRARLQGVEGAKLVLDSNSMFEGEPSLQNEVLASVSVAVEELAADPIPCAADILSRLANAFGYERSAENTRNLPSFKGARRLSPSPPRALP